jgi:tol-pal system protein YbgF
MAGDFVGAEMAFKKFLADFSDDELAGEAQYWLGEVYYSRGAFSEAGKAFAEGLEKYPNSPRGPDTLLKLGMSLASLQQIDAACQTYNELDRRYPNASPGIVQRVNTEKQTAGCL